MMSDNEDINSDKSELSRNHSNESENEEKKSNLKIIIFKNKYKMENFQ